MIRIEVKKLENVALLKLQEGTYEELSKIEIRNIRGLGGFTIKETLSYLIDSKEIGYVAYNFKTAEQCNMFIDELKQIVKTINNGAKGVYKLKI